MISAAVFGAIALASQHPWIMRTEGYGQLVLWRLRGPLAPPSDVVILAIDEYSLSQGGAYTASPERYPYLAPIEAWPWQRQAYATAIDRLMEAGARTVAVDVLFLDASLYGPADDAALEATLAKWGDRVVLAALYESSNLDWGGFATLLTPKFQGNFRQGLINIQADSDGQLRLAPDVVLSALRQSHDFRDTLPSFASATLQGAGVANPQWPSEQFFFYGPGGTIPTIPFTNVLEPENWERYRDQVAGKIVLIGPTAVSLQDFHRTPFDNEMPGPEVHAQTITAMIEGRTLNQPLGNALLRGLITGLIIGGVGLGLGYRFSQPIPRLIGFSVAITLWGGTAYLLMMGPPGQIIPLAIPVACLGMGGLAYIATGATGDRLEEQRLRRTLERYVSPSVAKEILNQPEDFTSLGGGQQMQAAVLFSDIRGFSRLSYQLGAEQTVHLLNTYLNDIVAPILAERGTIDKFIGDAVMAEFGAPTSQGAKQDAICAVRAALGIRTALADLRQRLQAEGLPPLFNGIGISYGDLVVGNVGSPQRLEYTAIGDTVNVASRIEGLTKVVGTDLLITRPLYDLVQEDVIAVDHGLHLVAGREQEAVQVYGIIGLRGDSDTLYQQVQRDLQAHLAATPKGPPK
ncbi:MAG: adenylate/guanylate cyclase domain-containing protein [Leptolyngbya sp.]|nr:adenylate/guanylate cyclase domain-containing protein [Leptolyngbya sp.]